MLQCYNTVVATPIDTSFARSPHSVSPSLLEAPFSGPECANSQPADSASIWWSGVGGMDYCMNMMIQTHSLLFHPILFCRITNNSIHFFSRHAKRSRNFDNKNVLTKIIT